MSWKRGSGPSRFTGHDGKHIEFLGTLPFLHSPMKPADRCVHMSNSEPGAEQVPLVHEGRPSPLSRMPHIPMQVLCLQLKSKALVCTWQCLARAESIWLPSVPKEKAMQRGLMLLICLQSLMLLACTGCPAVSAARLKEAKMHSIIFPPPFSPALLTAFAELRAWGSILTATWRLPNCLTVTE